MKDYSDIKMLKMNLEKDLEYAYNKGYEKGYKDAYDNAGKPVEEKLNEEFNTNFLSGSPEALSALRHVLESDYIVESIQAESTFSSEEVTVVFRKSKSIPVGLNSSLLNPYIPPTDPIYSATTCYNAASNPCIKYGNTMFNYNTVLKVEDESGD